MRKAILLFSFLIFAFCTLLKAQYTAVNITSGFNADVVANGVGAPTTTTNNDVDGVGYCLIAPDYQYDASCTLPTPTLPASGLINSKTTSGLSFQMGSFSANQDLRLAATDTGLLSFATGISAQTVYLLAFSGSGASQINATVHFSDGSSQVFSAISINDWFASSTNVTATGMGRVINTVTACGSNLASTTTPIFFEVGLQLNSVNYLKTVTSVSVSRVNGVSGFTGIVNVLGVSTLAPPTACSGTPNSGNTITSAASICPSVNFTLTLQNPLTNAGGISYQWQSSSDSITWTDIAGANSASYTTNITAKTYFHCVVKCTLSSLQATSSNISVTTNPPALCVCSPNNGTTLHGGTSPNISAVSIPNTSLSITSTATPTNGYISYTSPIPDLIQGQPYTLNTTFSGSAIASVWFDWNNDGILDASEWTQITTSGTSGNTSFTVDAAAVLGKSIMRVRARATGNINGATDACTEFFSGQTMDFVINIIAGTPCTGAASPGTAIASSNKVCPNTPFNLTDTGSTFGVTGLTYQWQMSINGGTNWTDIAGADSFNHYVDAGITVPTCYRRGISCGAVTTYSTSTCVSLNPTYACYCGPNSGNTLHTGTTPTLDSVSLAGTSLNISTLGITSNGYTLHLSPVPTLSQGVTYTLYTQYSGAANASAWIDWNNDGLFDASEWYQLTSNGTNSSVTFTVPTTASVDSTILRIRTNATFYTNGSGDACTSFFSGETEDFLIYVNQGVTCSGTPVPGTTVKVSPTVLCSGTAFNLDVNGASANLVGLTYQWQSSTDNSSWNDIAGETNPTYTNTNGITDSMYYRRVNQCNVGGISISSVLLVKLSGAISSFPFTEGFESLSSVGLGILPNCWTTSGTTKFTSTASAVRNKIGARTGTHCVWSRYSASTYLISPSLSLTGGKSYTFSYYYRPTDPIAGFYINTLVASSSDTTSLSSSPIGASIANPVDTSKWILASYSYTPATSGTYYFAIQSKCSTFSPWDLLFDDINISDVPLGVTMISFTGNKDGNKNKLHWTTTNETNNKGFELQRSKDGNTFEKIGFVASKADMGNSSVEIQYNFEDEQPFDGNNYYRLKQLDLNGKESYSNIIMIKGGKGNKIEFTSIYPNPAKDLLKLDIYTPITQNLNVIITDISGRTVKQINILANNGNNQFNVNVDALKAGTYLIKASSNNGYEAVVQKFMKQ